MELTETGLSGMTLYRVGTSEHGNEPSGFIKCWKFFRS
jgi:hypothetical protein